MEGIQKSVAIGLRVLAEKVKNGDYGKDDSAFGGEDDCDGEAFLRDLHDEVIEKMQ